MHTAPSLDHRPRRRWLAGPLALGLAVAACTGAGAPSAAPASPAAGAPSPAASAAETPRELTKVSLVLDYLMDANKAPFVLGKEKGFFEEQGIDLTITEGTGSGNSAKFVANGQYNFGLASSTATFSSIANGLPIVMVANHQPRSVGAILVKADGPIKTIQDLKGRSLGVGTDGNDQYLLPAILKAVGLTENDVEIVLVNENTKTPLWLSGRLDANSNPLDGLPDMLKVDPTLKARAFMFSDYGLNVMAHGLIATRQTVAEKPDLVKRMVAAYAQSYLYAATHKDEMIETVVAQYPAVTAESMGQQFDIIFSIVSTDNTKDHPFGYIAPEDVDSTITALELAKVFESDLPNTDFYTNEFIGEWEPLESLYSIPELVEKLTK